MVLINLEVVQVFNYLFSNNLSSVGADMVGVIWKPVFKVMHFE